MKVIRRSRTQVHSSGSTRTERSAIVTDGLDRPTSLEFIKDTAYIVTIAGEVWIIDNVEGPPYGI